MHRRAPALPRTALLTGVGRRRGIGAAIARGLAEDGCDLALSFHGEYDRRVLGEDADVELLAEELRGLGRRVVLLPGDLTDADFCRRLVEDAVEGLGGLDALVNNAGRQIAVESLEEIDDQQWEDTYAVNIHAMFRITQAALKHLPAGSTIVNSTSIQAYEPSPTLVDYASTKAAINNFTKGLAQQLAPRGIRVNAVAPGPIWTPLQVSDGQPKEALPEFGKSTPLGRAGQPTELAPAYVFLTSSESSYVLGETLAVTGGSPTP